MIAFNEDNEPSGLSFAEAETLGQADIDALFGSSMDFSDAPQIGLRAVIESNVVSHERLPMLEVIFDRMVRTFSTSMRHLTSDAIDVTLEGLTSTRFGDFMNHLTLPAMIGVFNAEQWENYGLLTVESSLIYAVVDALLGGRRGTLPLRVEGRAFTTIETMLVSQMVELALADMATAFEPIAAVNFQLDRMEASPRFAAIARPTDVAMVATFRVDMEDRGGRFSILLPLATIEPVRGKLLQRFMGEKLGRDNIWEAHLESELRKTEVVVDAVLGEVTMTLRDVMNLKVGQTISLGVTPEDPLALRCDGVALTNANMGQQNRKIAVRLNMPVSKAKGSLI